MKECVAVPCHYFLLSGYTHLPGGLPDGEVCLEAGLSLGGVDVGLPLGEVGVGLPGEDGELGLLCSDDLPAEGLHTNNETV